VSATAAETRAGAGRRVSTRALSGAEAARLAGITYRKVDYWCRQGVLGEEHRRPIGSGQHRRLTALDVTALRAIERVSQELAALIGRESKVGSTVLYRLVADQVRSGADVVRVRLGDHVELTVDVADLREVGE
jgi:hypothetical protein